MKLTRHNSLKRADAVLALVMLDLDEESELELDFTLQCYANGREQGYAITRHPFAIAFAESRNSDDVVVYQGEYRDFSPQGFVPSEEGWENAQRFQDIWDAAQHVLEQMDEHARENAPVSKGGFSQEERTPYDP